jgi:RHS repeat-associated protein/uncharacterized delta-60 repeat protein
MFGLRSSRRNRKNSKDHAADAQQRREVLRKAAIPVCEALENRRMFIIGFGLTADFDGSESGPTDAQFTISACCGEASDPYLVTITYEIVMGDGSATPTYDYDDSAIGGSVQIWKGDAIGGHGTATITIPVIDDNLIEGDETVTLHITSEDGYSDMGNWSDEKSIIIGDDDSSPSDDDPDPTTSSIDYGDDDDDSACPCQNDDTGNGTDNTEGVSAGNGAGDGANDEGGAGPMGLPSGNSEAAGPLLDRREPLSSDHPVRYADGLMSEESADLPHVGAMPLGHRRSWSNSGDYARDGRNGNGWVIESLSSIVKSANGNSAIVILDGNDSQWFDGTTTFTSRYGSADTLTLSGGEYILRRPDGTQYRFYDFNVGLPAAQRGQFKSYTDAGGDAAAATYSSGQLTKVQHTVGSTIESYDYAYVSGGNLDGKLSSVTYKVSTNSGSSYTSVRAVNYAYYDTPATGDNAFGNLGDLKTATVVDGSSATIDVTYYRYYTDDGGGVGYKGGLQYVLYPQEYARAVVDLAALGSPTTPLLANPADLAPYASKYYEYDWLQRVAKETVSGSGCSTCAGGQGTYQFSYATSGNSDGVNSWKYRTTELLPDGNANTIYSNYLQQTMVSVFQETAAPATASSASRTGTTATVTTSSAHGLSIGDRVIVNGLPDGVSNGSFIITAVTTYTLSYTTLGTSATLSASGLSGASVREVIKEWSNYTQYNASAYPVMMALPSAVSGYWDASADLLTDPGAGADAELEGLRDSRGKILRTAYYLSTTANSSTPGGVAGYRSYDWVQHGEVGTKTSTLSRSGSTVTVSSTAHGFSNGDFVVINGADQPEYNGGFVISNVSANSFDYTISGSPATPATGTIKAALANLTSRVRYLSHSDGSTTVYPVADYAVYRNADQTGIQVTSFTYNSWTGHQPTSITTTLPTVTTAQNGPNSAASMTDVFDAYGRLTWSMDAGGFITYRAYDAATGAMTKFIDDVDVSRDSNHNGDDSEGAGGQSFAGLPGGWTLASGGGLHHTTTMVVDRLGRVTNLTLPNDGATSTSTYTVYNDAAHEVAVYPGWSAASGTTTGPVLVSRENRGLGYSETFETSHFTPSGSPGSYVPPTSVSVNGETTTVYNLVRQLRNAAGQVIDTDRYVTMGGGFSSSATSMGSAGTDYYRTQTDYDAHGLLKRVIEPTGTIRWTVFDALGRVASEWVGTNDNGFSNSDPSNGGAAPNNMVKVAEYQYDGGGIGDSLLTKMTLIPGGGAADQVTEYYNNWRGQQVGMKMGVQVSESDAGVQRQTLYCLLDNFGRQVECHTYDSDNDQITRISEEGGSDTDGLPNPPTSGNRRGKTSTSYDEQGRVYRTLVYSVDQGNGNIGDAIEWDGWYDTRSDLIKSQTTGSAAEKTQYDGQRRPTTSFITDAGSDSGFTDADDVTSDIVLEQTGYTYDKNDNVILTTFKQRFHDATHDGALGDPSSTGSTDKARVSYQTAYYDAANRLTASADYGTNGGTLDGAGSGGDLDTDNNAVADRPTSVPSASDSVLVTSYTFNNQGLVEYVTNPRGIQSKTEYDLLDRPVKTIAGYANGTPDATDDQTTLYGYDGNDHLVTLTADMPSSPSQNDQVTQYVYGERTASNVSTSVSGNTTVALTVAGHGYRVGDQVVIRGATPANYNGAFTVTGVTSTTFDYLVTGNPGAPSGTLKIRRAGGVADNNKLEGVQYPDKSTGAAGAAASDQQAYTYDALGNVKTFTDQVGSIHEYSYDVLNRRTKDAVTTLGSGVDGGVRRIESSFDPAGRLEKLTRYNASSSGSVVNEIQYAYNDLGQLTTEYQNHSGSVNTSTSPKVQYGYDTTNSSSVLTKGSRPTTMTYPNGRVVTSNYNGTTLDNTISRLTSLSDSSATLESYTYLGLGTLVSRAHVQPGLDQTYLTDGTQEAGDQYAGLDRFGRVIDQDWIDRRDPNNGGDDADTERFKYGFDRGSNVLFKNNIVSSVNSELYSASDDTAAGSIYDKLGRLQGWQRGALTAAGSNNGSLLDTVASATRTQNWTLDALGNMGDTTGSATTGVTTNGSGQNRKHNSGNQLTEVAGNTLTYDNNGSMTQDETGKDYKSDAWNRIVAADIDGDANFSDSGIDRAYTYDGAGRRVTEQTIGSTAKDLYHSANWQVLEEKVSSNVMAQNVWSPVYIDALVERDNFDTISAGALDSTFDSDGKVTIDLQVFDIESSVTQSDGKTVIIGRYSASRAALARLNADGSLDTTFDGPNGNGDGWFDFFLGSSTGLAWDVAIQADGKIVVAGQNGATGTGAAALGRFNTDGSWDTSFDGPGTPGDGRFVLSTGQKLQGVAIQADGQIVAVGSTTGTGDAFVIRMNASDGSYDNTFDSDGQQSIDFSGSTETATRVAIDRSGRIVVLGTTSAGSGGDMAIARLTSAGALDTTFDSDGKQTVSFTAGADTAEGLAIDDQNRVLIAGGGSGDLDVARLLADGTLDTAFDGNGGSGNGKVSINFSGTDVANAVAVDGQGRVVVVGTNASGTDLAVARLNGSDGTLDTTFDSDGKQTVNISASTETAADVLIQPDGMIVIGGSGGDFEAARLGGGGTRLYAIQDANYNVTAETDATGVVVERYQYDPYGVYMVLNADYTVDADGVKDVDMPFGFQGGREDAATGNVDFRNRFYRPSLGRPVQADPLGYVDGMNLQQWVGSDPTNHTDPFGLAGDGHHRVGQATYEKNPNAAVRRFFDSDAARISNDCYTTHNGKLYNKVSAKEYNDEVRDLSRKLFKGRTPDRLTDVNEARQLLNEVDRQGPETLIGRYNQGVQEEADNALRALRNGVRVADEEAAAVAERIVARGLRRKGFALIPEISPLLRGVGRAGAKWGPGILLDFVFADDCNAGEDESLAEEHRRQFLELQADILKAEREGQIMPRPLSPGIVAYLHEWNNQAQPFNPTPSRASVIAAQAGR